VYVITSIYNLVSKKQIVGPLLYAKIRPPFELSLLEGRRMAASAVFILDHKGKILISRNYRGDVPMSVASRFIMKVLEEEELNIKPIIEEDGVTYIFVKHNNLFCILLIILCLFKFILYPVYFRLLTLLSISNHRQK
jgi:hypothetical protein